MSDESREGRLYLVDPEVDKRGWGHAGCRGLLWLCPAGVMLHVGDGVEVLGPIAPDDKPPGSWGPLEVDTLIPWHRVASIEFGSSIERETR